MAKGYQIKDLQGNYQHLSFPVLGIIREKNDIIFSLNAAFKDQFLPIDEPEQINFLIKLMQSVELKKIWHHAGDLYHIDQITEAEEDAYYFFILSKHSIRSSYLWLKHDLLNVLNPIMGFADILSESENIDDDEQMLIEKIKSNAERMYDQLQKLAVLQNLAIEHKVQEKGHYYFRDFMIELADKIQVNGTSCQIEEQRSPKMNYIDGRIGQAHFRSALEEFLIFLSQYQSRATIICSLISSDLHQSLQISIPKCSIPEQLEAELLTIEQFSEAMGHINRLQLSTINYMIICEWMQIMGGKSEISFNDKEGLLQLKMPIIQSDDKDHSYKQRIRYTKKQANTDHQASYNIPEPLLKKLKKLWKPFEGLIILDEWNDLLLKMRGINQEYKNEDLDKIITDTESAVNNFDVEKLRDIYKKMTQLLN